MCSDKDDWYSASLGLKLRLQFKTGHPRHANVGDQARSLVAGLGIEEFSRGAKAESGQAVRLDQIFQRTLKRLIIVNDCHSS